MSWASIVNRTPNQHKSSPIKVKYNLNSTFNADAIEDNLPRHKEITPGIADDFLMTNESNYVSKMVPSDWTPPNWNGKWVDFEEYKELTNHKEFLPLSIQRIIEFAQQRIKRNEMTLDYNEIERDLKYQYKQCNGDSKKLKKLYFDIPKKLLGAKEFETSFNLMYFNFDNAEYAKRQVRTTFEGFTNYTLVHYLINEIVYGNLVSNDPTIVLLTLLIKNNIIDCSESIHCTIWDGGEYTLCDMILYGAIQAKRCDEVTQNVENFVELIMCSMKQQNKEALVTMRVNNHEQALSHHLLDQWVGWMNFSYCPDEYHICNEPQIIERLLFRGVLPFQCITLKPHKPSRSQWHTTYARETVTLKDTKQCLDNLFDAFKICENISDRERIVNHRQFPVNQMALTAPLVILPHLNTAKKWMRNILVNDGNISKEIANIICEHLFMNYSLFFSKELQNNLNVQSMIFLDHLAHFGMDKLFSERFYAIYNTERFVNYFVDNHLRTFTSVLGELVLIDFDVIISLIQTYNDSNDKEHRFPLEEKSFGIYTILKFLMRHSSFDKYSQTFIKLLVYAKTVYKDEFDVVNYNYQLSYDGTGNYRPRYKGWGPETFMSILLRKASFPASISAAKMNVAKFVLTEFKSKDDVLVELKSLKKRAKSF